MYVGRVCVHVFQLLNPHFVSLWLFRGKLLQINNDNVSNIIVAPADNINNSGRGRGAVADIVEVKNAYDFYSYSSVNLLNSVHPKLVNTILY